MIKNILLLTLIAFSVTACLKESEEDRRARLVVPPITDPDNPVDWDGNPVEKIVYLESFCKLHRSHDTCKAVGHSMMMDRYRR